MNELMIDAVKKSAVGPAQITGTAITGKYLFKDDFIGFSGHFPGYPILPAVVQLIAAQCLIEEQKGHGLVLFSVQNAKFLKEIRPGDEISVRCSDIRFRGEPGSRVEILSGKKIAASFIMTFSE